MTTPALPTLSLSDDERDLLGMLVARIRGDRRELELSDAFYNAEQVIEDLGISVPPELGGLHTVVGWPGGAVDSLDERLDGEGFRYPDAPSGDDRLWEWWQINNLDEESQLAHVDAMVFGRSYVSIGSPLAPGEPPVIAVESALDMAVEYDARAREVTAAARLYVQDGEQHATLYMPGSTIHLVSDFRGWKVEARDDHGFGIVPIVRLANRQRAADRAGKSEITTAVRSITQSACRTLLGMEVAREFYNAPQRYVLGAAEEAFLDQSGNPLSAWETYTGRVLGLTRDEDGNMPQVGTFAAYSPETHTRVIEQYARLMAAQTGMPAGWLGISTDQPASADAIRMAEQRHVKKAERKQRSFGGAWEEAMRVALLFADGEVPDPAFRLEMLWRDAATPTKAAQWDSTVKGVQAGILPPDSSVTYDLAGLSLADQQRLAVDRRRAAGASSVADILARARGRGVSGSGDDAAAGSAALSPSTTPSAS